MTDIERSVQTTRTLRFHAYGEPADVLQLETVPVQVPGAAQIRIAVKACGLNPADWALCRGLFAGALPRGVGIDVSGVVEALGDGVSDVAVGDRVLGTADWAHRDTAGASDRAIMDRWTPLPANLDFDQAAALPMAVDTASRHLTWLGLSAGQTILIHGGGSVIGFAAVQMALARGARVIATAGETHAARLREFGATVTRYGEGMVDRVRALADGSVDLALDTAPVGGALPDLVRIVGGDPRKVMTIADFEGAKQTGVRDTFHEDQSVRIDLLPEFTRLAAAGRFEVPISRRYVLDDWRTAMEVSLSGKARGKLLLVPG